MSTMARQLLASGNSTTRDVNALRGLYFPHHWYLPDAATFGPSSHEGFAEVADQIGQYLEGERREFDLPLAAVGDDFNRRVWLTVQQIRYGDTVTYGASGRGYGAANSTIVLSRGAAAETVFVARLGRARW